MAAAGPARWDVTADPIRPQNSQTKGGPSSTVPAAAAAAAAAAATRRLTAGFFSPAPPDSGAQARRGRGLDRARPSWAGSGRGPARGAQVPPRGSPLPSCEGIRPLDPSSHRLGLRSLSGRSTRAPWPPWGGRGSGQNGG